MPALLTLVAVLLGSAVHGIVGAVLAIPVAAAAHLLVHEIVFPRLDHAGADDAEGPGDDAAAERVPHG